MAWGDSRVCAECHPQIAASYAQTGMARSFRAVRPDTVLPQFDGSRFEHKASAEQFTAGRRDGRYFVRREQSGANVFEESVDYILGSGNDWISYLHRTRDNISRISRQLVSRKGRALGHESRLRQS